MIPRPVGPIIAAAALLLAACAPAVAPSVADGTGLLYVWAGDVDGNEADFLAVVDARPGSETYGSVLKTVPVEGRGNWPHHTEYELTPGAGLWANGWGTGRTFMFDLTDPLAPRLSGAFGARGGFAYPHSYARLPNGNVLATFQTSGEGYTAAGGLVELDAQGELVRAVSGVSPDVPANETWSYSLLVLSDLDRVVSTNTRMGLPDEWMSQMMAAKDPAQHQHVSQDVRTTHVQVWRLSDLVLLHTIKLPAQDGGHEGWTAEPRRLANGDVYVNTFSCGLYRIVDVAGVTPSVTPTLATRFTEPGFCAVPVVVGNFWIQPSATDRTVVAYDLSNAAKPREVSRVTFDSTVATPHWLSLDPSRARMVLTFDSESSVMLIDVDPTTGALTIDEKFRDAGARKPGVNFDRPSWPHGAGGRAQPHGAVFGVRSPE